MAEKRVSIKKVDGEKMAAGIYAALFTSGATFEADVRAILPGFDSLPEMGKRVVAYGLKQKLDDSMAGVEDEAEAIEEVTSTWDAIVKGQWTLRVAGEGVEGGLFARAFAAYHELSLSDAKAKISELVEKNLATNKAKFADKPEEAEKITDRMVFNQLRARALEKYERLNAIYEELKAKQKKKTTKPKVELDIDAG